MTQLVFGSQGLHADPAQGSVTEALVHDDWATFYPHDMPSAWRLDYYSHFYGCVFVPQTQWVGWTSAFLEEVAESLEDTPFLWVLQCSLADKSALARLQWLVGLPGFEVVQVLLELDEPALHSGKMTEAQQAWQQQLPNDWRVTFSMQASAVGDVKQWHGEALAAFAAHNAANGAANPWIWQGATRSLAGCPLGWFETLPETPKQQAGLLQTFVSELVPSPGQVSQALQTPEDCVGCICGPSVGPQTLRELKVMAEVMGA